MRHVIKNFEGPKYTQGAFAPGRIKLKVCPNCGRRIDFDADSCPGCSAYRANNWKPFKEEPECELHTIAVSAGGYFKRGEKVEICAKNGYISFNSGNERKFVNLANDFFLCSKRETALGKTITLVFSDFAINLKDDEFAEQVAVYIYSSIVDRVYERENCFYNATHELFPE